MLSAYLLPLTTSGPLQAHFGRLSEHARQGEQQQNQAAAARQQLEEGGDFDYIKAAAHAAGMDEMDAKLKGAWEERPRDFGKSVGGACSIQ